MVDGVHNDVLLPFTVTVMRGKQKEKENSMREKRRSDSQLL